MLILHERSVNMFRSNSNSVFWYDVQRRAFFFRLYNVIVILNICGKMTLALGFMKLSSAVVFGLCEILLFSTTSYSPHILTYTTVTVRSLYSNSNAEITIWHSEIRKNMFMNLRTNCPTSFFNQFCWNLTNTWNLLLLIQELQTEQFSLLNRHNKSELLLLFCMRKFCLWKFLRHKFCVWEKQGVW